jgi:hypothetical protein
MLINALPEVKKTMDLVEESSNSVAERGLLLTILAFIEVTQSKQLSEEELKRKLENMGVVVKSQHSTFGDVEQLIKSFAEQKYIVKEKDGGAYNYKLGPRTFAEFTERDLYQFIFVELMGNANLAPLEKTLAQNQAQREEQGLVLILF